MIDSLKELFVKTISAQAYAALVGIPGFGWVFSLPVIRPVVQFIIFRTAKWAVQETSVGLSLLWISVDLAYEVESAEDARRKLEEMLNDPVKYSAQEQKRIEEHFDQSTIDLIQLSLKRLA